MSYDYIKRRYSFVPVVGERVRHTVTGNYGVIAREDKSQGHYVMVRFDGRGFRSPCHPDELEKIPGDSAPLLLNNENSAQPRTDTGG